MSDRNTIAVILVAVLLAYILAMLAIMLVHWRRYRRESDRYRAWQSVFGRRGAKIVLISLFVAVAALVGLFAALQSAPDRPAARMNLRPAAQHTPRPLKVATVDTQQDPATQQIGTTQAEAGVKPPNTPELFSFGEDSAMRQLPRHRDDLPDGQRAGRAAGGGTSHTATVGPLENSPGSTLVYAGMNRLIQTHDADPGEITDSART